MKVFNSIIQIIAVIGISIAIYLFVINKSQDEMYDSVIKHNVELDSIIGNNKQEISQLKSSNGAKDKIIESREFTIASLQTDIINIVKETDTRIEELSNLSLEEVLTYILSYYETDSTEAELIMHENSIQVIIKPRLMYEWSYTLAKLESRNIELLVYKNQVEEYALIVEDFKERIQNMDRVDSLRIDSMEKSEEKNSGLQEIIDNRNKKIKSITMQRNIVAGIAVIVFVIILI